MSAENIASAMPSKTGWSAYKKYVIGILLVVYTLNFIDRQIIAILSPAIKADLGINDTATTEIYTRSIVGSVRCV